MGHLIRSLALANIIKVEFECCFISREPSEAIQNIIKENNHKLKKINSEEYLKEATKLNNLIPPESILVLDGYFFNDSYIKSLKDQGHKTLLIEDFGKSYDDVNVILNHSIGHDKSIYKVNNTKYYIGPDFALLRKAFLDLAKSELKERNNNNIFVCFGGADWYNVTLKSLKALNDIEKDLNVHVVLGHTHPHRGSIENFAKSSNYNLTIHYSLNEVEMAEIIDCCSLAIAPSSGISYEICSAKSGFISGYFVDNQEFLHNGLKNAGCICSIGDLRIVTIEKISEAINTVLNSRETIMEMQIAQSKLIDGKSDERLKSIFHDLVQTNNE